MSLVEVRDLSVTFQGIKAVSSVDLDIEAGQRWAVVGKSGSGKTTLGRSLLAMRAGAKLSADRLVVGGIDVLSARGATLRRLRGGVAAMVMQDSLAALNPLQTIGSALLESQAVHLQQSTKQAQDKALAALQAVQLRDPRAIMRAFPHQLSGGQRQRACVALATITDPAVLVADEPTSALDPALANEVCTVLKAVCDARAMALVLITHDLAVAAATCTHIAVMSDGEIVERGELAEVLKTPAEDATRQLLQASAIDPKTPPVHEVTCS